MTTDSPCPDLIELRTRVNELEKDVLQNKTDIRALLDFMAGVKMLLSLSIGGGALSVITLILTIANLIEHAGP